MAIAKRVRQDACIEQRGTKNQHVALVIQIEEDGKVSDRETIDSGYERIPNMVSVAQPDRVLLDMSLEEAQALRLVVYSGCGGDHPLRKSTDGIDRALRAAQVYPAPYRFPYNGTRLNLGTLTAYKWGSGCVDLPDAAPVPKDPSMASSGVGGLGPIKGQAVSSGQANLRDASLRAQKAQEVDRAIRSVGRYPGIYW